MVEKIGKNWNYCTKKLCKIACVSFFFYIYIYQIINPYPQQKQKQKISFRRIETFKEEKKFCFCTHRVSQIIIIIFIEIRDVLPEVYRKAYILRI